jgi:O-antigen/teichoic acid export membrane protein
MRHRFIRDVSAFSLGNLAVGVLFMFYVFLTARLLGEAGYGLFQALMGLRHGR